jgi:hypothetical protein
MGVDATQEQGPNKRRGTSEKTIQLDVIIFNNISLTVSRM